MYGKLIAASTLVGGLVACVASFVVTPTYVSSATLRIDPRQFDIPPSDVISEVWQDLIARKNLAEIIQQPALNLHPRERDRLPLEDVIETMKAHEITLDLDRDVTLDDSLRISFHYLDPKKAQATVNVLIQQVVKAFSTRGYQTPITRAPSLPDSPEYPNRTLFLGCGLAIGLFVGLITSCVLWRPLWSAKVLGCGLAGAAAVGAISLLIPDQYTSHAMFRIEVPREQIAAGLSREKAHSEILAWMKFMQKEILSDPQISELVQRPTLDLYPSERTDFPLMTAIKALRKDMIIECGSCRTSDTWQMAAFSISFQYPDALKAQAAVSAILVKFQDAFQVEQRRSPTPTDPVKPGEPPSNAGWSFVVLDPASLAEEPKSPNRWILAAAGLVAGMLISATSIPVPRSKTALIPSLAV